MILLRIILRALLAFAILSLASCIDGREEIWIHANGSGKADLQYDIPATAARLQGGVDGVSSLVASLLKDFPDAEHEVIPEGERLKVRVRLSFASPDDISKLTASAAAGSAPKSFMHLAGIFDVKRLPLGVEFTRTVSPGKALPTAFIPPAEYRDRKLTYILHLPIAADESTADRITNGGKTLTWEQPLAAAMRQPIVIHFKATVPIPAWAIVLAVLLTALAVFIVFRIIRRFRRAGA